MITNPQDAYKKQGILTASPAELIVMLFEGLKKNLLMGQRAIVKSDMATAHAKLIRAQEIIAELINSLDMSYEISQQLLDIYEFLLGELAQINISKDAERITPLFEIVDTFRDTWREVSLSAGGRAELCE
jgi:flagellar protein FliS